MKKILILIVFSTIALNAMQHLIKEEKSKKTWADLNNKECILLKNINTALDENNSFENLKTFGDKIPTVDKSALNQAWVSDSPKNHAETTIKMTEVMLIKALEIKLQDGLCAKTESATQEKIAQMVIKLQNDYNNAKNNQEYIKAVALKFSLGSDVSCLFNK